MYDFENVKIILGIRQNLLQFWIIKMLFFVEFCCNDKNISFYQQIGLGDMINFVCCLNRKLNVMGNGVLCVCFYLLIDKILIKMDIK